MQFDLRILQLLTHLLRLHIFVGPAFQDAIGAPQSNVVVVRHVRVRVEGPPPVGCGTLRLICGPKSRFDHVALLVRQTPVVVKPW